MTKIEKVNALVGKTVVFTSRIEVGESDFAAGMKAKVTNAWFSDNDPDIFRLELDFSAFEEYNKKFMKAEYYPLFSTDPEIAKYGHNKHHLIKWCDTKLYPANKKVEEYFDISSFMSGKDFDFMVLEDNAPTCREALQCLVNYWECDPDLYKDDDDGSLRRCMARAYKALQTEE